MMPVDGYKRCVQIMTYLFDREKFDEIDKPTLEQAIMVEAGTDDRTIEKYIDLLERLGFVDPVNHKVWRVKQSPSIYEGYGDVVSRVDDASFERAVGVPPETVFDQDDGEVEA